MMRIAITGATGNLGTSLLQRLAEAPEVEEIVGIARRAPALHFERTRFVAADVTSADLGELFRGMDAVVHLAWRLQPSHRIGELERTNVDGSARVFAAVARARVPALVSVTSVGVYSSGPKERAVDESWPTEGVLGSSYSMQKSRVERLLDRFESDHPERRVVRIRPAFVFKREAASGIRKLFLGRALPRAAFSRRAPLVVPDHPRLRFQALHSLDVGAAFRAALLSDVRGAFHLAAEPVLDAAELAEVLGARRLALPARLLRGAVAAAWRLHLQPSEPGWVDLALASPIIDPARARAELGWRPEWSATQALAEVVEGLREGASLSTPALARPGEEERALARAAPEASTA